MRRRTGGNAAVIDPARQQWTDGRRRLEAEQRDPIRYGQLWALAEVLVAELRRRIGQRFTLVELAAAHRLADDWARQAVLDALPHEPKVGVQDVALVVDVAFDLFARGAVDFRPD